MAYLLGRSLPNRQDNILAALEDGTFEEKIDSYNKAGRSTGYSMDSAGNIITPSAPTKPSGRLIPGSSPGSSIWKPYDTPNQSPLAQSNMQSAGLSQPQRMSRRSVFGAMQPNNALQREYPDQRMSGIDAFRMRQNRPSAYSLNTGLAGPDALENMRRNYNEMLPPSLQRSTPVGRSRHSPERIAERELRAKSRYLDRQLSPFY